MKKTLFATLLALTVALFAFAAAAEVTVEFADEFEITHPDALIAIELTQDDLSEGMVYAASSDDMDLYIWSGDMDGMTADELYAAWQEDDYLANVATRELGDRKILCYDIDEEGKGAVIAGIGESYYEIMCFYEGDAEETLKAAESIMASITAK